MVEQRSPKPSVACSTRVSPAKKERAMARFFVVGDAKDMARPYPVHSVYVEHLPELAYGE